MKRYLRYKKWYKVIKESELFDVKYYIFTYPDIRKIGVDPIKHYIKHGANEGRNPSAEFNTLNYLNANNDVMNSGINPLAHYILYGKNEGREKEYKELNNTTKSKVLNKINTNSHTFTPYTPFNVEKITAQLIDLKQNNNAEIVVIFHIYYPELISEVSSYFKNITQSYSLVITYPKDKAKEIKPLLKNFTENRIEIEVDNQGYDVLPFLELLVPLKNAKYKLFCKVHTKRDHDDLSIGKFWRESLLDGMLGDSSLVSKIIGSFNKDKKLYMVGSELNYISYQASKYENDNYLKDISKSIDIDFKNVKDFGFFAGTMFWGDVDMFSNLSLKFKNFLLKTKYSQSGTTSSYSHSIKRAFGLLTLKGYSVGLVDYELSYQKNKYTYHVVGKEHSPSIYPANLRYKYFRIRNFCFKYFLLLESSLLDSNWCYMQNIELTKGWKDSILQFLDGKIQFLSKVHENDVKNLVFSNNGLVLKYKNGDIKKFELNSKILSQNIGLHRKYKQSHIENKSDIEVSVICTTYNHEKYIKQALESLATQKTNFKFEVLVGDDCSTDKTAEIVKKIAHKYPTIIVPILRDKNIGPKENHLDLFTRAKGKYVALNEGDDYWNDKNKLQKQVDYLNNNEECSVCFHPVNVIDENDAKFSNIYPKNTVGNKLTFEKLMNANLIQTNSVMYRNNIFKDHILHPLLMPGDWYRHLLNSLYGEIYMLPDIMATYRKHDGGIWSGLKQFDKAHSIDQIIFNIELNKDTNEVYHNIFLKKQVMHFEKLYWFHFENNNLNKLYELINIVPDTANLFFKINKIEINPYKISNQNELLRIYKDLYKVDVVITSYNHEEYIEQTLTTVFSQKGLYSLNIIIADDCSTDDTLKVIYEVVNNFNDLNIIVFPKSKNLGMLKSMKRSFEQCHGEYTAICEGDDYWLSDLKLNKQLSYMLQNPEATMCFNWLLLENIKDGTTIPHPGQAKINNSFVSFDLILKTALTANFSCCFYNTDSIKKIPALYFDEKRAADWLFNLYIANLGKVGFIKEKLSVYRVHDNGQWSGLSLEEQNKRKQKTYRRFLELFPTRMNEILPYINNNNILEK